MTIIKCDATDCVNNIDGECGIDSKAYEVSYLSISMELTAAGFHPICQDYNEKD